MLSSGEATIVVPSELERCVSGERGDRTLRAHGHLRVSGLRDSRFRVRGSGRHIHDGTHSGRVPFLHTYSTIPRGYGSGMGISANRGFSGTFTLA